MEDVAEKGGEITSDVKEEKREEEWRRYDYALSDFGIYTVGQDYVVFPFLSPREGFLYLPADAFEHDSDFAEAVKLIAGGGDSGRAN